MPVNRKYSKTQPLDVKSYDFKDIVSKTGYITFYGARTAQGYFLTQQNIFSHTVGTVISGAALTTENDADQTPDIDLDFDTTFKAPQIIEGEVIVQVPHGFRDSGNQTTNQKVRVIIRKVVDGVETDLVTLSGNSWTPGMTAITDSHFAMDALSGEIPRTLFTVGDTFRLTTHISTWESGGNTHSYIIGHDPAGRLTSGRDILNTLVFSGSEFTTLKAEVPFKIQ